MKLVCIRLILVGVILQLGVRKLGISSWRQIICVENYIVNREWHFLQALDLNPRKIAVTGHDQEPLLVNPFPTRRNGIISKGVKVQPIGA